MSHDPIPTLTRRSVARWAVLLACVLASGCATRPSLSAPAAPDTGATTARAPDALADDVTRLRSPDFVERARAAERLVRAGERALPALGAAGDGTVNVFGMQRTATTPPVMRAILSNLSQERLTVHLDSPYPALRRETAEELGRRGRWDAVPRLIARMGDDDVGVRAASAASLRRLTNRFFGFDPEGRLTARRRATDRWREWWAVEGRLRAQEGDTGGSG